MSTNKYEKYFDANQPSVHISYVFFGLCDKAKENDELDELRDAFLPAYQEAEKREAYEMYGI